MRARISLAVSHAVRTPPQIVSDVKIGLVKRERLDQGRIVLEDRMDLLRDGPVDLEPRRDEHDLGTPPHRDRRRHRGANTEASRFVTCCSNHASLRWVADRHRSILEIGIVALLNGRIESVHVNVNDLTNPPLAHSSNV